MSKSLNARFIENIFKYIEILTCLVVIFHNQLCVWRTLIVYIFRPIKQTFAQLLSNSFKLAHPLFPTIRTL